MTEAKVVLATHNQGKLTELRAILAATMPGLDPAEVISAGDLGLSDVIENGTSFAENALIKARHVAALTGLISLADDSGLSVKIMNGSPGIFSARWSGLHGTIDADQANIDLLLAQLSDIGDQDRSAAFVCAAALVSPSVAGGAALDELVLEESRQHTSHSVEHVEHGYLQGNVLRERRGEGGFGYDPIFLVRDSDRSLAEFSRAEKNTFSHRHHAFTAIAAYVQRELEARYSPQS